MLNNVVSQHDMEDDESPSDDDPSAVPHPGFIAAPDQTNDVPLPEGVDPKNVEDIFLGLAAVPVPAEWSEDEDEVSCLCHHTLGQN